MARFWKWLRVLIWGSPAPKVIARWTSNGVVTADNRYPTYRYMR